MISTFNILKEAFTNIAHSSVQYRKFQSKSINDFGVTAQTFSSWETSVAIVQPGIVSSFGGKCIELKDYKEMGLDWSRRHITVWLPYVGLEPDADRDGADQIKTADGRIFNVLQVENWGEYTGYSRVYCVEKKA